MFQEQMIQQRLKNASQNYIFKKTPSIIDIKNGSYTRV